MKHIVLVALALALVCAAATVVILKRQAANEAESRAANAARAVSPARAQAESAPAPPPAPAPPAAPEMASPTPESVAPPEPVTPNTKPPNAAAPGTQNPGGAKEPLKDPGAREALAFVGVDPDAEAYWCGAINNPDLSPHERQDLIEDLNEDGLSDPKHPGPQDLPVIYNRIQLIENVGPFAMDQVNADAFAEAYKDLLNLADLAMGSGEPVR